MPFLKKLSNFFFKRARNKDAITHTPLLSKHELRDLLFRVQARQLQTGQRHDVSHRNIGDARSLYRGHGLDYEESRPYQQGDEMRTMNWRLTARTGEMYMKVFREERRPDVFILLDRRAGMRFGTRVRLKVTQAARAASVAAFAAQQRNVSVSGVMLDDSLHWLEASFGEQAVFNLVNECCAPCPPVNLSTKAKGKPEAQLGDVLSLLHEILTPGTTLYLISDFIDIAEPHRGKLMQLASQHEVHALHVFDPMERALPRAGKLKLVSPVSAGFQEVTVIDTNDTSVSQTYTTIAEEHFAKCAQLFRNLDIHYRQIETQCDAVENEVLSTFGRLACR